MFLAVIFPRRKRPVEGREDEEGERGGRITVDYNKELGRTQGDPREKISLVKTEGSKSQLVK